MCANEWAGVLDTSMELPHDRGHTWRYTEAKKKPPARHGCSHLLLLFNNLDPGREQEYKNMPEMYERNITILSTLIIFRLAEVGNPTPFLFKMDPFVSIQNG